MALYFLMEDDEVEELLSMIMLNRFGYFDCVLCPCPYRFINFYNLRLHVYLHHLARENFTYECALCDAEFETKHECDLHENSHLRCNGRSIIRPKVRPPSKNLQTDGMAVVQQRKTRRDGSNNGGGFNPLLLDEMMIDPKL